MHSRCFSYWICPAASYKWYDRAERGLNVCRRRDGIVQDIEQGKKSGERLYFVKYTDGDCEHLTADQMKEFVVENGSGRCKVVHSGDEAPRAVDPFTADRPKTSGITLDMDQKGSYTKHKAQSKTCDNGRGMCKAGVAEYAPRVSLPTTVGRSKLSGITLDTDQKGSYVEDKAQNNTYDNDSGMCTEACKAGVAHDAPRALFPSIEIPGVKVGMGQKHRYVGIEAHAVNGNGVCKAGFAPRALLPSVVDRPKMPDGSGRQLC